MSIKIWPVRLLIFQSTPFCNIDCKYCNLGNRTVHKQMTPDIIEAACKQIYDASLPSEYLTALWHAGKPLVSPISWCNDAFSIIKGYFKKVNLSHAFQTNGILVNQEWVNFIRRWDVQVGVSIDGPSYLHDRNRVTRSGRGTSDRALDGV